MTELSRRARDLFEAGHRSLQPTTRDRTRNLQALAQRLEGGAPSQTAVRSVVAPAGGLGLPAVGAIVLGLAAVGGGIFELSRSSPRAVAPVASVSAPLASASSGPAPSAVVPAPAAAATASESAPAEEPESQHAAAHTNASANDRLAEEVSILSAAERALRAGRYRDALHLLDEHRRKFPKGTLVQERIAARVQALCGLGRVSDAQAELARLSPTSLHGARADACPSR